MACNNYYISIVDTQADPENSYIVTGYIDPGYLFPQYEEEGVVAPAELVASRSVQLSHRGGDRLDVPIIGSSLSWTFVGLDCRDGRYQQLFSGDENRFRVTLSDENDVTLWQGFVLPDAYQEPYRNYVQNVSFQATDGLGRLKGKIPQNYPTEISVVDAISMLLRLTGLNLQLRFAPGIVNYGQSDYKQIYIPTAGWAGRDAYDILIGLVGSLASTVYQADGYWCVEGWNVRAQVQYWAEIYNAFGGHQTGQLVTRQVKRVEVLADGNITLLPPYGLIEVSHQRVPVGLPEGLSNPERVEWIPYSGAGDDNVEFAQEWVQTPDFPVYFDGDRVYFVYNIEQEGSVSLRRRPFIQEGERYVLRLVFGVETFEHVQDYSFRNPFDYRIILGEEVLYSNIDGQGTQVGLYFTESEASDELRFEFVARDSGLLDIELFPPKTGFNGLTEIVIEEATLERVGFESPETLQRIVDGDFTTEKQVTLEYADDMAGTGSGFRLEPIDQPSDSVVFEVPILREVNLGSSWANIVSLRNADLIEGNIGEVFTVWPTTEPVEVERVEYNWAGSQEHAFITTNRVIRPIGEDPEVRVRVNAFNAVTGPRTYWDEWSDTVYQIERNTFLDTFATLLERSFGQTLEQAQIPVWENLKINDILVFDYDGEKTWAMSSCLWDVDAGRSDIVATKSVFESEALPPTVEIGVERLIVPDEARLTAVGFSPTNGIVSYQWEILEGTGSFSSTTNPETTLTLVSSRVRARVTVTDENGLTASDEVDVFRDVDVNLFWEEISAPPLERRFRLHLSEPIPDDYVILITGSADLFNFNRNTDRILVRDGDRRLLYARLNPAIDDQSSDILNGSLEFAIPVTNQSDIVVEMGLREPEVGAGEKRLIFEVVHAYYSIGYGEVLRPPKLEIRYVR